MLIILAAVTGYLLGSIPWGLVLARAVGFGDIRHIGSGSTGATNVLRTGNKTLAALTLALDLGKGVTAVLIASLCGPTGMLAAAGAVIVGHICPIWLGFRGGKGVAVAFGVLLVIAWPLAITAAALWLLTAAISQYFKCTRPAQHVRPHVHSVAGSTPSFCCGNSDFRSSKSPILS